jgi:hypothetical protein
MKQPQNERAPPAFRADIEIPPTPAQQYAAARHPNLALNRVLALPEANDDQPRVLIHQPQGP